MKIKITYKGITKEIEYDKLNRIYDIVNHKFLEVKGDGDCGVCCACATCHVIVDDNWIDKLSERSDDEEDMLDILPTVQPGSRLGCQVELDESHDGIEIVIPEQQLTLVSKETILILT